MTKSLSQQPCPLIGDVQGFDRSPWVATAYLLTSTGTVAISGKLADF